MEKRIVNGKVILGLHLLAGLDLVMGLPLVVQGAASVAALGGADVGTASRGPLLMTLIAGLVGILIYAVLAEAAALGYRRGLPWGMILAAVAAFAHLPGLAFPIALFVLWQLLPQGTRSTLLSTLKENFGSAKPESSG